MKVALGLSYDGAQFCGWQSQPSLCGVQDALEGAIAAIAQHPVRVHAAGRTDTGVHALGQVVHFETDVDRPLSAWVRGVNANLPETVRVEWAHLVDEDFHARFSAFSRSYQYLLYNAPVASALMANKAGWFHLPLDFSAMQEGASYLIGEHDFSAFRAAECQAKSPIKTMSRAEVRQCGNMFVFDFEASAFLHHMVRNLVGTLVYIGKGTQPAGWVDELLQMKDRKLAAPTFSPDGLYFRGPVYESHWNLPALDDDFLDGALL